MKVLPSQLDDFFWTVTYNDLQMAIKLYMAERQAEYSQGHQNLVLVVNAMFSKDTSPKNPSLGRMPPVDLPVMNDGDQVRNFLANKMKGK